jgi:hypothetical protein
MFEKKKEESQTMEAALNETPETAVTEMDSPSPVIDYGVYNDAIVRTEQSDVIITIPVGESVVTIRAPQALIAQNATDNIAGSLIRQGE